MKITKIISSIFLLIFLNSNAFSISGNTLYFDDKTPNDLSFSPDISLGYIHTSTYADDYNSGITLTNTGKIDKAIVYTDRKGTRTIQKLFKQSISNNVAVSFEFTDKSIKGRMNFYTIIQNIALVSNSDGVVYSCPNISIGQVGFQPDNEWYIGSSSANAQIIETEIANKNKKKKGDLTILCKSEDGHIKGILFEITSSNQISVYPIDVG